MGRGEGCRAAARSWPSGRSEPRRCRAPSGPPGGKRPPGNRPTASDHPPLRETPAGGATATAVAHGASRSHWRRVSGSPRHEPRAPRTLDRTCSGMDSTCRCLRCPCLFDETRRRWPTLLTRQTSFATDAAGAPPLHRIAFLGNHSPRICGLATFTGDLRNAVAGAVPDAECLVLAMTDGGATHDYPPEVRVDIADDDARAYGRAAGSSTM